MDERRVAFSALQRAEIAEIVNPTSPRFGSVILSVLFNEPKLLKFDPIAGVFAFLAPFSALQRAEIAEIHRASFWCSSRRRTFSALQRAEIAEIDYPTDAICCDSGCLSVLFNEPKLLKCTNSHWRRNPPGLSVLFNEPKLLKSAHPARPINRALAFSALQRAEIAEIAGSSCRRSRRKNFQCSSTSRNC